MAKMVTVIETKNIPADKFETIANPHRRAGAQVKKIDQGGGLFTMRATYPRPVEVLEDDDLVEGGNN